ncbi:transposase [Natrinema soli]|uniref:Transposase n=1 Tax=Natrinema soli TaxID=1930624 RepID=A0ABD5SNR2_9EURY|nr:transposase [Natrinema soli]
MQDVNIKPVQIPPKADTQYFKYRVLYEQDVEEVAAIDGSWLSIDLGVVNLAMCVDHRGHSFIVGGRHLISQNRWFNKRIAHYQSIKDKQGIESTTRRIERLY